MNRFSVVCSNNRNMEVARVGDTFSRDQVPAQQAGFEPVKWATRREAQAAANNRAEFGTPSNNTSDVCVVRQTPGRGWVVVNVQPMSVWDD
jgi:hypothetical protein